MLTKKNIIKIILAMLGIIFVLRLISLGLYPLFDPTEGRYAEIGRKMLESGNFVTPFIAYNVPFWAKPPLSFWLTAFSYKIFGVNEFASRLPSFFCMGGILWLVWNFAKDFYNKTNHNKASIAKIESIITVLILCSMGLFFYLAGGVMTDPSLALGITLTMFSFWHTVVWQQKKWGYGFFAGIIIALLAKGPIGVILMGTPIFIWVLVQNKWKDLWQRLPWVYGTIITLMAVLPWYILAEMRTPGFLNYFIIGEHFERFIVKGWKGDLYGGGRAHTPGTIWIYAFAAMLPWSLILLAAPFVKSLRKSFSIKDSPDKNWQLYLWLWALTPLVFFTLARNILITYVISALPAFAILLTPIVNNWLNKKYGKVIVLFMALFVPLVFSGALMAVNIMPDSTWIKSEEEIVKIYQQVAKDKNAPLLYYGKHSYSEDFYSGGRSIEIQDINDMRHYLYGEVFLVIQPSYYSKIPSDLQMKLAIVVQKNNSMLLKNIQ